MEVVISNKIYATVEYQWGQSWRKGIQGRLYRNRLWVRFPLEELKYLLFSFFRSSVEAKRGVESLNIWLQNSPESVNQLTNIIFSSNFTLFVKINMDK